ncbi:MAG TPA: Gfo/Idh/MocA family oxidoreductase [Chloroflexia bacterium]|nr:Gfo/Idh/MocA family oxidoreductase [Chloroflexia bacterium]
MKIAMLGTGWFATEHLKLLSTLPEVEITAHLATTPEKARAPAQQWGGNGYTSLEKLLEKESIEAAWLCLPPTPAVHLALEPLLLAADIPYFLEKPLAADLHTAEKIFEQLAEKSSPLVVAVGYHWRALDTLDKVRDILAKNPVRLVVGTWYGDTPGVEWWQKEARGGGQVVEQATHLFDLARYLVGDARVTAASANYFERPLYPAQDVAGTNAALLQFEKGQPGVFSTTCILQGPLEIRLQLICEGLAITISQNKVIYETGQSREEVETSSNPYLIEDQAFLEAIRQQRPELMICSYEEALKTHRLCWEVAEAGRRQRS